jgi:hypothetical protein
VTRTLSREAKKMRKMAMRKTLALGFAVGILGVGAAHTQFGRGGGSDWNTGHLNAQRTSSIKADAYISKDAMEKGGFQLQWKIKVENQPRQMTSLISAVTLGGGLTKPLSLINGSSNTITAVDNDTGIVFWTKHIDASVPPSSSLPCPGAMSAGMSRPTALVPPAGGVARGAALSPNQQTGYTGMVGQPGEGLPDSVVLIPSSILNRGPAPASVAVPAASGAGGQAGTPGGATVVGSPAAARGVRAGAPAGRGAAAFGGGLFGAGGGFYALSSDGVLHTIGENSGKELQKPVPFLPANAYASDLIAVPEVTDTARSNIIYAATMNGCGGVPNRVWAVDLAPDDKPVTYFDTGASPVGPPALASDGTLYVALGAGAAGSGYSHAVVGLEAKTLKLKDWFTEPKADFASTPTIFKHGDKEIVAAATKDGRIYLLDTTSLGGSDHETPLFVSSALSSTKTDYVPSALASWQDLDGTTWIAEPFVGGGPSGAPDNGKVTNGGIVALKLADDGGKLSLSPAWVSQDMISPLSPIVINGVVFAASSGEYHPASGAAMSASERTQKSVPAVLYALDATTGAPLWSSGKTITSFVADTPLWASSGQTYIATYDNSVYAFGFAMERYVTQ